MGRLHYKDANTFKFVKLNSRVKRKKHFIIKKQ